MQFADACLLAMLAACALTVVGLMPLLVKLTIGMYRDNWS